MNKFIALLLCGLLLPLVATAKYVDPDEKIVQQKREERKQQLIKQCKVKNFDCKMTAIKKARYEFPSVRGSDNYIKKHYSNLTKSQAKEKLRELKALYKQVEDDESNPDDWYGKIDTKSLDWEAKYLARKYFGMNGYGIEQVDIILKMY
ncbi:hypothetical protein PDT03_004523 [Salmonella enterica]|nr:hypothetical protein [Salmonella enterica]